MKKFSSYDVHRLQCRKSGDHVNDIHLLPLSDHIFEVMMYIDNTDKYEEEDSGKYFIV